MFASLKNKIREETGSDLPKLTANITSTTVQRIESPRGEGSTSSLNSLVSSDGLKDDASDPARTEDDMRKKLQRLEAEFARKLDDKEREWKEVYGDLEKKNASLEKEKEEAYKQIHNLKDSLRDAKDCKQKLVEHHEDKEQIESLQMQVLSKVKHLVLQREQELKVRSTQLKEANLQFEKLRCEVNLLRRFEKQLSDVQLDLTKRDSVEVDESLGILTSDQMLDMSIFSTPNNRRIRTRLINSPNNNNNNAHGSAVKRIAVTSLRNTPNNRRIRTRMIPNNNNNKSPGSDHSSLSDEDDEPAEDRRQMEKKVESEVDPKEIRHSRANNGTKPKCSICEKIFTSNSNLKKHLNIHRLERPYKCHCGATFKRRDSLQRHIWKRFSALMCTLLTAFALPPSFQLQKSVHVSFASSNAADSTHSFVDGNNGSATVDSYSSAATGVVADGETFYGHKTIHQEAEVVAEKTITEEPKVIDEKTIQGAAQVQRTIIENTVIPQYVEKTIKVTSYVEKTIRVPTVD